MATVLLTGEELEELVARAVEPLRQEVAKLAARGSRPPRQEAGHIGIAALARRLSRGRSTIADWCRAGTFPAPHHCGQRRCWFVAEVEEWEAARRPPGGGAAAGQ